MSKERKQNHCRECGDDITYKRSLSARFCFECVRKREVGRIATRTAQGVSGQIVNLAIKGGMLPHLKETEIKCVDCGNRAQDYDHRDYLKPLDVDPVCRRCNLKRGPGRNKTGTFENDRRYTGKPVRVR